MSGLVTIRFYEELNDFLPPERRKQDLLQPLNHPCSVKDFIENIGIPHTEIDLILVNGRSVDFSYQLQDGDRISVYPVFESLDITPVTRLRPKPLRKPRFVLDQHLGKLAHYLRMLGFDCLYRNDYHDPELAAISAREGRILLTCDRRLLMRKKVSRGYFVRERDPEGQLREVVQRLDLRHATSPFTRCMECNGLIEPVDKETIMSELAPRTRDDFDEFRRCTECGRLYWRGSHYDRMQELIARL
ncbi:MAG: Mut7-C RNAse domain-containing protein [Chromatiales bacterium]|jgi:hypothetical protein